ncbi:hypothetical protein EDE05_1283 [Neorhizobium sp. R1-B]|uniref:hypothetical protein n=1 Tax=unclassified Neorhizobium TaxID=2629175 RepID=UPI00104661C4|nr:MULTISPECIES: hypothetical protein [unclassified Neorhizobium]TCV66260.1 hypothetical protein EDE09_11610 [Neorhizobium sp. S3-V5DH]TDX72582.1 hypothetical protein EDE05_1283 [Neorhizobium sp. R1-B]
MDQLANLPAPALITFGAVLAVIFAVRYLGLWQGQKTSPSSSPASAQVAAVIVDPTALNKATAAVEAHTAAMHRAIDVEERRTRATETMAIELDRIREELRIHREIRRADR